MSLLETTIKELKAFLITNGRKIFINPRLPNVCSKNEFSSGQSFFRNYNEYLEKFSSEYDASKYLVGLEDGSYFQYSFTTAGKGKREHILKCTIAYLPSVSNGGWKNDYLRFDFCKNEGNFFHNQAHLHIGLDSSIRFPVDKLFSFEDFCSLVFYLYYNEYFEQLYNKGKTIKGKYSEGTLVIDKLQNFMFVNANNCNLGKLTE